MAQRKLLYAATGTDIFHHRQMTAVAQPFYSTSILKGSHHQFCQERITDWEEQSKIQYTFYAAASPANLLRCPKSNSMPSIYMVLRENNACYQLPCLFSPFSFQSCVLYTWWIERTWKNSNIAFGMDYSRLPI